MLLTLVAQWIGNGTGITFQAEGPVAAGSEVLNNYGHKVWSCPGGLHIMCKSNQPLLRPHFMGLPDSTLMLSACVENSIILDKIRRDLLNRTSLSR
jgi:hypothetical protein